MKPFLQKLRYELSDKQLVFAVKGPHMKTLGIVAKWRGRYSHYGWKAFRGHGLTCHFLKAFSTRAKAIRAVIASAPLLLVLTAGCALPKWQAYPGAGVPGMCAAYATVATADLRAHGIAAYRVAYLWRAGGQSGAHAVCLFRASDGRFALVENTHARPIFVSGDTILALLKSYDSNATTVWDWDSCPLRIEGQARTLVASFYTKSKRRDGLMANGKIFNPDALTCASWSYYGKWLRVTGPLGSVVVYASDKGPAKRLLKSRSLDLSRAAFAKICYLEAGLIEVEVEVLNETKK